MVMLLICWRNNKPFKLEIDGQKTILDLKKQIASHYNETYTGFNVINGTDIIDSSKNNCSISSCGLNRVVRLPDNYNPGHAY